MAGVNFYLKEPKATEPTGIFLKSWLSGKPLKFYTGEKIHPKEWSATRQRPKPSYFNYDGLSSLLERLSKELQNKKSGLLAQDQGLNREAIKQHLCKLIDRSTTDKKLTFLEYFDHFLEVKKVELSKNYLRSAKTLRNHLHNFSKVKKISLKFESITLAFYETFVAYLYSIGLTANTVGTNINRLKYFMQWATSHGYNNTLDFKEKKFRAMEVESFQVALSEEELMRIFELDLSGNKKLHNVRETFCFGCFTGLRFSDISKITAEDISGDYLNIAITKTKQNLRVPLIDFAQEILNRNGYRLPSISNQKTNDYLKELAQLAGLSEPIKIMTYQGATAIEVLKPKYDLITTHTARRSFITISLAKGIPHETIMSTTGHKSYKNFQKYIKLTDDKKLKVLNTGWRRAPELLLKRI